MRTLIIISAAVLIASAAAVAALFWWLDRPVPAYVVPGLPGQDNAPKERSRGEKVEIGKFFRKFSDDSDSGLTGEWSRFRGGDSSNICNDGVPLADAWPKQGPRILWSQKLGEGHAAAAIYKGRVFVLDYIEEIKADALRCFSLADGRELWRRWYIVDVKRNHGRSRTVPAVNENVAVTIGPKCQVMCVSSVNGDLLWGIDLVAEYGSAVPQWYTGQCPLIDGSVVVLAPAGKDVLMTGVDAVSGKVLWKTPNPAGWKMSHSSVTPMTFDGRRMYVYCAQGGIAGISAEPADAGKILWESSVWSPSVVAPSPQQLPGGMVFATAGYGFGSVVLRIKHENDGTFKAETIKSFNPRQALSLEQQSPILYNNTLYGIRPKDAGAGRCQMVGADPGNIAEFIYAGGRELRFGLGPFIVADNKFYILDDNGTLTMMKIDGSDGKILGSHRIIDGNDAWGPLAVADGRMILRDLNQMVCIDLTGKIKDREEVKNHGKE
ncbi:MAG: PQQ-binding-like beta-propeller repeat protein [Victivallaceae bacterium]